MTTLNSGTAKEQYTFLHILILIISDVVSALNDAIWFVDYHTHIRCSQQEHRWQFEKIKEFNTYFTNSSKNRIYCQCML